MLDNQFDVSSLSEEHNMSRTTLYRKIKAVCGISPNQLIRKVRLKKSLSYLNSGEYSVSETADAVGINDISYYISCFKKEYKCTPKQYSEKNSKKSADPPPE